MIVKLIYSESLSGVEQELVTRYLLSRILDTKADQDGSGSIVYPQVSQQRVSRPLRKLLDQAKDNIDVIDFRSSRHEVRTETRTMSGLCQHSVRTCLFILKDHLERWV